MKNSTKTILFWGILLCFSQSAFANFITATPANYTGFLTALVPGDTLFLSPGIYTNNLTLKNLSGTATNPIVVTGAGNATIIQGQSCCNTVSITKCAYLVISNFELEGLNEFVDAVKAEGTTGNWAHHVTIENLYIIHYGFDQQAVGISTKCAAWDWIIRKNTIIGAGTGMYLGNSDGTRPFVNGLIENNYIANTIGYNLQVKHQLDNVRAEFPGTAVDGKTIIRNNVFAKDNSSSTGTNARPNLLVGGFPLTGWGSMDYYEIYGNFFYGNPVEALFQGTGNITLYDNVFVNHYDPPGFRAVYITPQNGVSPQDVKVFHNTIWVKNSGGGLRLNGPNANYHQYCYGNAAFGSFPITNFTESLDNVTDTYDNAISYFLSATTDIASLDLYPKNGQLTGASTPSVLFANLTDEDLDFNGNPYDWTFRGAYSGCCTNPGWHLQLDTMPVWTPMASGVTGLDAILPEVEVFPNPSAGVFTVYAPEKLAEIRVVNALGQTVQVVVPDQLASTIQLSTSGVYFLQMRWKDRVFTRKIIKN